MLKIPMGVKRSRAKAPGVQAVISENNMETEGESLERRAYDSIYDIDAGWYQPGDGAAGAAQ